jgi:hypothetical protein
MNSLQTPAEKVEVENETAVKRKKGRPRKEVQSVVEEEKTETEKKKRGRKKKEVVEEEVKQKKKRGRKAAVKFFSSSIRKKIPLTTVIQDNNNFILHLDIKDREEESLSAKNKSESIDLLSDTNEYEQLKEVKKDIQEMLDNDDSILTDYLEQRSDLDLRGLYEKRIEFRESQDKVLVDKLEKLRHDDKFIVSIVESPAVTNGQECVQSSNQEDVQSQNRKKGYFELLYQFIHNKDWLSTTDVCCWWCCHSFDSIPIGLPLHYNDKISKFRVKGVFCSFACMIAYKNDNKIYGVESLIKYLHKKLTGNFISNIQAAPPRCTLKMFGGELTVEEFRKSSNEHTIYKMVEYPMYASRDYVEEVDIANLKSANNKVFDDSILSRVVNLDDKRVEDAKSRLSQLDKTTVTLGNTIDKFIKIT